MQTHFKCLVSFLGPHNLYPGKPQVFFWRNSEIGGCYLFACLCLPLLPPRAQVPKRSRPGLLKPTLAVPLSLPCQGAGHHLTITVTGHGRHPTALLKPPLLLNKHKERKLQAAFPRSTPEDLAGWYLSSSVVMGMMMTEPLGGAEVPSGAPHITSRLLSHSQSQVLLL